MAQTMKFNYVAVDNIVIVDVDAVCEKTRCRRIRSIYNGS